MGVIADTMLDAFETADSILQDINSGKVRSVDRSHDLDPLMYSSGMNQDTRTVQAKTIYGNKFGKMACYGAEGTFIQFGDSEICL